MTKMREDFKVYPFVTVMALIITLIMITGCDSTSNDDDVNNNRHSAEENFDYKIGVDNRSSFNLYAINGTIDIVGIADLDSVEISGKKIVESESIEDAQEYLAHLFIDIDYNPTTVRVETEQPNQTNGRNYTVEYEIKVPLDWKVYAEQVNGNIDVQSLNNDLVIDIVNGNANIRLINGEVDAQTDNGIINMDAIYGSVNASTVNGSLQADVVLHGNDSCELQAVNGNIILEIPVNTSAEFAANVSNGNISINGLTMSNQSTTNNSVTGTLGDGDGTISLTVVNGNITVGT